MFRGFVIWVALLACFVQPFFAQSITGKVVNQELTPIPYVSCVLLKLPDSTFVAGATSSMDGCFELAVPEGSYVLKLSYIGYKAKELECSSGDLGTIVLEEDVRVLDEVVLQKSGRMKLRHAILKGDNKPCLKRLYSLMRK